MQKHYAVVLLALALIVAIAIPAAAQHGGQTAPTCFPAAKWGPAPDDLRPCVRIRHVEEDASFSFTVSDADGTTRYTSSVGALDR